MEDENRLNKYFYIENRDLLKVWLDHSRQQPSTINKPTIDEHIVAFIYHQCDELELKKEIAFMAVELTNAYIRILEANNVPPKHVILSVLTIIVISNNLVGFRPNISKSQVIDILRSYGFSKYNVTSLNKCEVEISYLFQFKYPLTTMLDDVHALVGNFLQAPIIIDKMQQLCEYILNVFYLNCKVITDTLDEYYEKKNRQQLWKRCIENRLYFPAGIFFTSLRIHMENLMYNEEELVGKVADYVDISAKDFNVFVDVFMNVFDF